MKIKYFLPDSGAEVDEAEEIEIGGTYNLSNESRRNYCAEAIAQYIYENDDDGIMWRDEYRGVFISMVAPEGTIHTCYVSIRFSHSFNAEDGEEVRKQMAECEKLNARWEKEGLDALKLSSKEDKI